MLRFDRILGVTAIACTLSLSAHAAAPNPVVSAITVADSGGNALTIGIAGFTYNASVTASDPSALPLSFTWDFGDGSALGHTNPVAHSYANAGTFSISLTVSNSSSSTTVTTSVVILTPNSGGLGVTNLANGQPDVIDPESMLGLSVIYSNGGLVELGVDTGSVAGNVLCTTEFDGLGTRSAQIPGLIPVNKFSTHGVFVAMCNASDTATGTPKAKCRLTLALGAAEVGETVTVTAKPANTSVSKVKLRGKFFFTAADSLQPLAGTGNDQVTLSGTIELPAGFDVTTGHEINLAIGNIIDTVTIDAKGKGSGGTIAKKLQLKFIKLPHGATKTVAGQLATISITMNGANFSSNGFDTEGITNKVTTAEKALKSINRTIQVGLVVGGTPYVLKAAPVAFKLAKNGASGSIGTRTGP